MFVALFRFLEHLTQRNRKLLTLARSDTDLGHFQVSYLMTQSESAITFPGTGTESPGHPESTEILSRCGVPHLRTLFVGPVFFDGVVIIMLRVVLVRRAPGVLIV